MACVGHFNMSGASNHHFFQIKVLYTPLPFTHNFFKIRRRRIYIGFKCTSYVEMASLPNSRFNDEEKRKEEQQTQDEESFSRAMQLVSSVVLSMALQSATDLGVFQVLKEAGEGAKLSAKEIASKISCSNPEAASMLDRLLALLSSHSILHSSLVSDHRVPPTFHRLYTMTPVAAFFVPNSDGVSLGPVMALIQDKISLHSWLNSLSLSTIIIILCSFPSQTYSYI